MTPTAVDESVPTAQVHAPRRRRLRLGAAARKIPGRFVVFALLAAAVVGVLAWLLSWWSPVPIREVTVRGAEAEKSAEILAVARIDPGTPIRELDVAAITERVAALPGIESAELELSRPWTVVVDVVERFPFAVVAKTVPGQLPTVPSASWVVVDAAGIPIREATQKPQKLPVVEPADRPAPALRAMNALPPEILDQVKKATVDLAGAVTLTLKSGTTILWGRVGQEAAKAQTVAVLMQYKPASVNVSVPSRPALKGELTLPKRNRPEPEESPFG